MVDEWNKEEQPNLIKKKEMCRGNKVIIRGEKLLHCFRSSKLFSYSRHRLLSFICIKRNWMEEQHREKN